LAHDFLVKLILDLMVQGFLQKEEFKLQQTKY